MTVMLPHTISRSFSKATRSPLRADIKKRHCKPPSLVIPKSTESLSVSPTSASTPISINSLSVSPLCMQSPLLQEPITDTQNTEYETGPICILPNLYLGCEQNAQDKGVLEHANIHYILNVAKEVDLPFFTKGETEGESSVILLSNSTPRTLKYKKVNWSHNQDQLCKDFDDLFGFIDQARVEGLGILVHCQCGVSRSASLIIAYVMRTLNLTLNQAYAFVKLRSPKISPNLALVYQLIELESSLNLDGPSDFSDSGSSNSSGLSSPSTSVSCQIE